MPTTKNNLYDERFFQTQADESLPSAREVVPLVLGLIPARTCIDVGCGQGAWLSIFREHGLSVFGCDGHYVDRNSLLIPSDLFTAMDLNNKFEFERTFDLCISLEVAEHLTPLAAAGFIGSLVRLSPCVLFSAAVPHQEGTGHINAQWPTYWADLFHEHGYQWLDPFRQKLWNNRRVEWWYRQNLFLYCSEDFMKKKPELAAYKTSGSDLMIVQPEIFEKAVLEMSHPRVVLRRASGSVWGLVKRKLGFA